MDRNFIEQEAFRWPLRPFLPVKKYKKTQKGNLELECGILVEGLHGGAEPIVYLLDLFELFVRRQGDLTSVERIEYDSIDDLLKDGWSVD